MPKYDLGKIGHIEFERMCQSLIQQFIGNGVEIYGAGKDGAREATFRGKANFPSTAEKWDGSWIFQVKYHDVSLVGVNKARKKILEEVDSELRKVTEKYMHECDNFILMTNVPLSPVFQTGTKDIIKEQIAIKYSKVKNIAILGADEICGLLDANPGIRRTYRECITSGDLLDYLLEGIESQQTYLGDVIKSYCFNLLDKDEKHAVLDDAGDSEDKRVELQDVFIDVNVKPVTKKNEDKDEVFDMLWDELATTRQEDHSALTYLLDDHISDIVLVGGPGEGKSTLTQFVSQIHRARITKQSTKFFKNYDENYVLEIEKSRVRIPFRVVLKDYAQWFSENSSRNLLVYLAERVTSVTGREINADDVHKILKKEPVLLILDGLDEVPEKKLKNNLVTSTITNIKEFRELFDADIKVIATTRPFGYTDEFDPSRFLHLNVQKLSGGQALEYTKKWIDAKRYDNEEAKRIFDKFSICLEDKVISVLTTTPLEVTIVLVIIRARGILPKQREELFETYMDTIYQREQKKNIDLLRTDKELIIGLHKYIAYVLQKRVETDETASLMEESEFQEHVKTYIANQNPMLDKDGLEKFIARIIKEAEERLILITNNPKGKVGFPLTSMREFLAAAHLVDTSSDTNERDNRFSSIAISPHWRNVVLFFAGRVGRTRPGEVSSMIDVCRSEIDIKFPDKYLKRGANLVIDMIEDRVMRVPRNEISAIQYAMTLLDEGFIVDDDVLITKLGNFSDEVKNQVIKPILNKKLYNYDSYNINLIWEIYDNLYGIDDDFKSAIRFAFECDEKEILILGIKYAIKCNLDSYRVITAWNKLNQLTNEPVIVDIHKHLHFNLINYLDIEMPHFVLASISKTMLKIIDDDKRFMQPYDVPYLDNYINKLEKNCDFNKNKLYMLAVLKIVSLYNIHAESFEQIEEYEVIVYFPGFINPNILNFIKKESYLFEDFVSAFAHETDRFTTTLLKIFRYLLDIRNFELLQQIFSKDDDKDVSRIYGGVFQLNLRYFVNINPIELTSGLQLTLDFDKYEYVLSEVNRIINQKSDVKYNAHKFCVWLRTNFNEIVEGHLDQAILSELREFLQSENIPQEILLLLKQVIQIENDWDFQLYILKLEIKFLDKIETRELVFGINWIMHYHLGMIPKSKLENEEFRDLIKILLEKVIPILTKESIEESEYDIYLRWLIFNALEMNLLKEDHLIQLANLGFTGEFKNRNIRVRSQNKNMMKNLNVLLDSQNSQVELLTTMLYTQFTSEIQDLNQNKSISQKLWDLYNTTPNKDAVLEGLAHSYVKWSKLKVDFLQALSNVTDNSDNSWEKVISSGRYSSAYERKEFVSFLENILISKYKSSFRRASLQRLYQITRETEKTNIEESKLNLPLMTL
ncbi:NACHT domain-containing protein [Paenibacillus sp. NPDC058071]|uniref:NACHT domain-containing protein n=1 Tax=Paenibacillus sp. NPDC058071 TaxID=3346326 RepID=UPI0036D75E0A